MPSTRRVLYVTARAGRYVEIDLGDEHGLLAAVYDRHLVQRTRLAGLDALPTGVRDHQGPWAPHRRLSGEQIYEVSMICHPQTADEIGYLVVYDSSGAA